MARKTSMDWILSLFSQDGEPRRPSLKKPSKRFKKTIPSLDFRTNGPPPRLCKVCLQRFEDWSVSDEDWNKLPVEYRKLPEEFRRFRLCKDDFRRLLREAGHDPAGINFSDEPWKKRLALWQESTSMPPSHAHLFFEGQDICDPIPEILECEVISELDPGICAVRLRSQSANTPSRRNGVPYLALWDRVRVYTVTGRPLLHPLRRLRSLRGLEQQLAMAQERDGAQDTQGAVLAASKRDAAAQSSGDSSWSGTDRPTATATSTIPR
jgi:hypothetical protein